MQALPQRCEARPSLSAGSGSGASSCCNGHEHASVEESSGDVVGSLSTVRCLASKGTQQVPQPNGAADALLQMLTEGEGSPSSGNRSRLGSFAKEELGGPQTSGKPVSLLSASLPGRNGAASSSPVPPSQPPPACLLLNQSRLSKIHSLVLSALRCRLFFPQPPVDADGNVSAPDAASTAADTGSDAFTRALLGAALVPSVAQELREAAGPAPERARPAAVSIAVVGDGMSSPATPRGGGRDAHSHPAGAAATVLPPAAGPLSLQFDPRLQRWLVSSMLTGTLLEEAQLMQRSYEIFPRKTPKQPVAAAP